MTEERLEAIEIKITDLQHTVEELNKTVYEQQKKIDHLKGVCEALIAHVKELSDSAGEIGPQNEPPPHY